MERVSGDLLIPSERILIILQIKNIISETQNEYKVNNPG